MQNISKRKNKFPANLSSAHFWKLQIPYHIQKPENSMIQILKKTINRWTDTQTVRETDTEQCSLIIQVSKDFPAAH